MNIEKIKTIVKNDYQEALFTGDYKRVEILLNAGFNPDKFDENDPDGDWTPIMCAVLNMSFDIVELLIKAGANLDVILVDGDLKLNLFELIEEGVNKKNEKSEKYSAEMAEAMKTLLTRWAMKRNAEKNKCQQSTYK